MGPVCVSRLLLGRSPLGGSHPESHTHTHLLLPIIALDTLILQPAFDIIPEFKTVKTSSWNRFCLKWERGKTKVSFVNVMLLLV